MLVSIQEQEKLNTLFQKIQLLNNLQQPTKDKAAKIHQILAYLEIIHSVLRKFSNKNEIVLIDCAAGNCYLSFLVNYYYKYINPPKKLTIHCIDNNAALMRNSREKSVALGFDNMHFHAMDLLDFTIQGKVDLMVSLHACDTATDKALLLGLKLRANSILSVSCCQHSLKKKVRNTSLRGITKNRIFKDRMTYMVGDSLRALLMGTEGYKADIFEFVSSRYTDKNIMLRARKAGFNKTLEARQEYEFLSNQFNVEPPLKSYIEDRLLVKKSGLCA